ncbi:MAG: SRPBCC family protein [Pseudomonadota bacterium]
MDNKANGVTTMVAAERARLTDRDFAALDTLRHLADAPFDEAHGLPPSLYTSISIAAEEADSIWRHDWQCVGLAAEIPAHGDYLTWTLAGEPVFVVRTGDGDVRAFSNVCRHRMMGLLEGRGNRRRIVCPYHAWTYNLDGRLIGAPYMDRSKGFDRDAICLPEIRAEVWEGWIYLTLNAAAPPLCETLRPLADEVSRYGMDRYVPVISEDHVWRTNWKLLCENFMEGYHLPVAHKATVGAWFPADETEFPAARCDGFTWQSFTKNDNAAYGVAHPSNDRLTGKWRNTSLLPTVFPAHMYVLAPDHLWYLSLRPSETGDPGETRVRFGVALAPEVHASRDDLTAYVDEIGEFFSRVNDEDRALVEAIYRGALAPMTAPGPLSWLERELHDFMGYLADRLVPKSTERDGGVSTATTPNTPAADGDHTPRGTGDLA